MVGNRKRLEIILIILVAGFLFSSLVIFDLMKADSAKSGKSDFSGNKFVSKIIDGDTIIIEGESVRLLGIDTDEKGDSCYSEAKKRIEELILNKEIYLETDKEDKDQYKRYLRYIFLDGENINLKLVQEGLAVARFSSKETKYKDEILSAENQARESKIGCKWQD